MADRAENNKVPTRNAPNSDQEPQRSRGPDDRPTPPPRDEMNRKTAPGRDSAAPSSPDSAANRIRATESLFARTINDFCNNICQKRSSLRRSNFQRPTYSITSLVSVADGRKRTDSPILTQQNNLLASGRDCSANHKGRRPPYKDRPSHFDVL